jgi:predicted chitinase/LysM repeat protein
MEMQMSEIVKTVSVERGETLTRIAKRNSVSLDALLAVNPQIRNPNALKIGEPVHIPGNKFMLTVRFVNSWDLPPIGVRYELAVGKTVLVKGSVGLFDNEAELRVVDGANISFRAQRLGETELHYVASFVAKGAHPVVVARINAVKLPSLTDLHPKSDTAAVGKPLEKPASTPASPARKDQGQSHQPGKSAEGAAEHRILPGECACGRDMTIDELAAIFPSRKKAQLEPFLAPINQMMTTYKIDSCMRKAHALAQIGHESGSLRYRAEILPAGKTEEQAYAGYKGRGLIQITFKAKYQEYGEYKGIDFLGENRLKLETYEYATDSAGWFWNFGSPYGLNEYADKNDLILISTAINGGFNGFDDRAEIFTRTHRVLNAPKCKIEANRSAMYLAFEKSKAYDTRDMAFAWGLWSDPASKRKGLTKESAASKAGYLRFLELNKTHPIKRHRFGFKTTKAMIEHAEERSQ